MFYEGRIPMRLYIKIFALLIYCSFFQIYSQICIEDKVNFIENNLISSIQIHGKGIEKKNIYDRMKYYKVPALSIAIINDRKVEWTKAYNFSSEGLINQETLFQGASISKPIAAVIALSLMQNNILTLDGNIDLDYPFIRNKNVTVRHLLSHTSGYNLPNFEGYFSSTKESDIPNILQILQGEKPSKNIPIELLDTPGEKYSYSGGGYLIVQKLMEELTQKSFPILAAENIFKPLNMYSSTFEILWPNHLLKNIAIGYSDEGPIEGAWKIYPEAAAAGIWTTPTDLAQFVIEIQNAFDGKDNKILSKNMVKELLTVQSNSKMGLGFKINKLNSNIIEFSFSGINHGYTAYFVGFTGIGQGAIVMTNSTNGGKIIFEIIRSICEAYSWPEDYSNNYQVKHPIVLDFHSYQQLIGKYKFIEMQQASDPIIVNLYIRNNKLFMNLSFEDEELELIPESNIKFFNTSKEFDVIFTEDYKELEIMGMKAHRI